MSENCSTFAPAFEKEAMARSRAVVARQAHNLKVGGSIPPSATQKVIALQWLFFVVDTMIYAIVCGTNVLYIIRFVFYLHGIFEKRCSFLGLCKKTRCFLCSWLFFCNFVNCF